MSLVEKDFITITDPDNNLINPNNDAFSDQILEKDMGFLSLGTTNSPSKRNSFISSSSDLQRKNSRLNRRITIKDFGREEKSKLLSKFEKENEKYVSNEVDSTDFLIARLDKIDHTEVKPEKESFKIKNKIQHPLIKSDISPEELSANFVPTSLPPESETSSGDNCSQSTISIPTEETLSPITIVSEPEEDTSTCLIDSLPDWEFWCTVVQDYAEVARKTPHLLTGKIRLGIPSVLRGALWQTMSQSGSTYLETLYFQLLEEKNFAYEKIIMRDIPRTFPRLPMFSEENGVGQTRLFNVMKAYSLYDTHVGYCQGLGFMVGPLLMNMPEVEAFCVFVRLMETYDMRTMFTVKMEGLRLRLYQLGSLISEFLPNLANHLNTHNISAALYASQWFLSLFAYTFPLTLVQRIFDVVFAEGAPETIMRVAIALLKKNEEKLLSMNEFEELITYLSSSQLFEAYDNSATALIHDAIAVSSEVSTKKLNELAEQYAAEADSSTFCHQKPSLPQKSTSWFQGVVSSMYTEGSFRVRSMGRNMSHSSVLSTDNDSSSAFFMNPEKSSKLRGSIRSSPSDPAIPTTEVDALRLAVHDLQTTSETHLTALTQLRHDHSLLKSDMISLKNDKFSIQEENEQLQFQLLQCKKEAKELNRQGREGMLRQQEHIQSVEKQLLDANMRLKELQDERDRLLNLLEESGHKHPGHPYSYLQNNFADTFRKFIAKN